MSRMRSGAATGARKKPLDIDLMLVRIADAVRDLPKAALFQLAEEGFDSPFEVLVGCIISIRTRDETTVPTARRLFGIARTPDAVARRTPEQIDARIAGCTFHEAKARQIHAIARRVIHEFSGDLPCDFDTLTSFRGVGPKCANLTLGIACGGAAGAGVGVDVHVHRVTNRWGYVSARSPDATMRQLHERLPPRHRVRLNALLVPFGKHICTGVRPKCSTCPVLDRCRQVGVSEHR